MGNQRGILHPSGIIGNFFRGHERVFLGVGFGDYIDLFIRNLYAFNLSRVHFFQKFIVSDFLVGNAAEHLHKKAHAYQRHQRRNQKEHQILLLRRLPAAPRSALAVTGTAALAVIVAIAAVIAVQIIIIHNVKTFL